MRPFDYLRILGRRWWIPVLAALLGMLIAFVTQPSEQSVALKTAPRVQFRAEHLLISNATSTERAGQNDLGFDRLSLLTIAGPVRDAALKDLKAKGWPTVIRKSSASNSASNSSSSDSSSGQNGAQRRRQSADSPGIPAFRRGSGIDQRLRPVRARHDRAGARPRDGRPRHRRHRRPQVGAPGCERIRRRAAHVRRRAHQAGLRERPGADAQRPPAGEQPGREPRRADRGHAANEPGRRCPGHASLRGAEAGRRSQHEDPDDDRRRSAGAAAQDPGAGERGASRAHHLAGWFGARPGCQRNLARRCDRAACSVSSSWS